MGTPCSTEKYRISPTASTGDNLNLDQPLVEVAYQFLTNIELFGNLESAPTIVGYYAKKLKDSGQPIEKALERLEQQDDYFQKVWNQLISELKIVSNIMRGAIKDPLFNEYLPIISYNLAEQQKILEAELGSRKGQQIRRAQSHIILAKVQRADKRHKTDKI